MRFDGLTDKAATKLGMESTCNKLDFLIEFSRNYQTIENTFCVIAADAANLTS